MNWRHWLKDSPSGPSNIGSTGALRRDLVLSATYLYPSHCPTWTVFFFFFLIEYEVLLTVLLAFSVFEKHRKSHFHLLTKNNNGNMSVLK